MAAAPYSREAEEAVLGGILLDPVTLEKVLGLVGPDDFHAEAHRLIFRAMLECRQAEEPIDLLTVSNRLAGKGQLGDIGGAAQIAEIVERVPTAANIAYHAGIVREKAQLRTAINVGTEIVLRAKEGSGIALAHIRGMAERLAEMGARLEKDQTWSQSVVDVLAGVEARARGEMPVCWGTGIREVDGQMGGFFPGRHYLVGGRTSQGKAQPLTAKILMEDGTWRTMGNLKVGDRLASVDGQESIVTGIYPRGIRPVFTVTMRDGRSTMACGEHLWFITSPHWNTGRVVDTNRLKSLLGCVRYESRISIPVVSGEFGSDENLPLDGYALGALLGNGSFRSGVQFSSADADTVENLQSAVGCEVFSYAPMQYRLRRRHGQQVNHVREAIRELGLDRHLSYQKFIPDQYLRASRRTRLALLQGLMDTDGWSQSSQTLFCTSSARLAKDVVSLVRSIGGSATLQFRPTPNYTYRGERRIGRPAFRVGISINENIFRCARKAPEDRRRAFTLTVKSVEATGVEDTQCITVSHPSRLYVTDDYIVTHNSSLSLGIARHITRNLRTGVGIVSIEMSKEQLIHRLIAAESGVPLTAIRRKQLHGDWLAKVNEAAAKVGDWPLHVVERVNELPEVEKAIRSFAQHGCRVVVVDHVGLVRHSNQSLQPWKAVGDVGKALRRLAGTLNLAVLTLVQVNREVKSQKDFRPQLWNLRDAGSLEEDADAVLFVHRPRMYDSSADPDEAEIIIAKDRDGETGTLSVKWDTRTASFVDRDDDEAFFDQEGIHGRQDYDQDEDAA